jgi:hypothetical protein
VNDTPMVCFTKKIVVFKLKKLRFQRCQISLYALNHTLGALEHTRAYFKYSAAHHLGVVWLGLGKGELKCSLLGSSADALYHGCHVLNPNFQNSSFSHFFVIFTLRPQFCLNNLQNTKTPKLTKTLENNKAKGLANVNSGAQICNIWHSSNTLKLTFC